jgi:hypothetical protein
MMEIRIQLSHKEAVAWKKWSFSLHKQQQQQQQQQVRDVKEKCRSNSVLEGALINGEEFLKIKY